MKLFRSSFSLILFFILPLQGADHVHLVGVARIDVTPEYPIRMGGYAVRKSRSEGTEQRIWAKALAISTGADKPVVYITLDNNGIAEETYRKIADRLKQSADLTKDRFTIASSHTHTGPLTSFKSPNLFVEDIPAEDLAIIHRYTAELITKIEQVALEAIKKRTRSKLFWTLGKVEFARNRRGAATKPVDHSLPVLVAKNSQGETTGILATYACHCTTLSGQFKKICGDWAGYAQEAIEHDHPNAVALISVGCGADANPYPREGEDAGLHFAKQHGASIASEVKKLLSGDLKPIQPGRITTRLREVELPFAPHFSKQEWEARAQKAGIVGYHARKNLARLEHGEKLPATLYYPIVSWAFDRDLSMLFLPGEVVVDYALRLRDEYKNTRLWITAYANYVPCYIPSRRILAEGGYEAEDSLWYYDRPARLSAEVEDLIVHTSRDLLP